MNPEKVIGMLVCQKCVGTGIVRDYSNNRRVSYKVPCPQCSGKGGVVLKTKTAKLQDKN